MSSASFDLGCMQAEKGNPKSGIEQKKMKSFGNSMMVGYHWMRVKIECNNNQGASNNNQENLKRKKGKKPFKNYDTESYTYEPGTGNSLIDTYSSHNPPLKNISYK